MNYFTEEFEKKLQDKLPGARVTTPDLDPKAIEMLKDYLEQILKNDQNCDRIDQKRESVL